MPSRRRPSSESPFGGDNYVDQCSITVGDQSSQTINVAVQLKDYNGAATPGVSHKDGPGAVRCYLSDNDDGSTLTGTAPDTVAVGTDGLIVAAEVTAKVFTVVSEDDGSFDLNITKSSAHDWYFVVILPDGSIQVSSIIHLT